MAKNKTSDKAVSKTISLPTSAWDELQKQADENYNGNRSSLIQELLNGNIGSPSPKSDNALVSLAESFHPIIADQIQAYCEKFAIDQRRIVFNILEALAQQTNTPNLEEIFELDVPIVSTKHTPGHYSHTGNRRPQNLKVAEQTNEFDVEQKRKSPAVKKILGKDQPSKPSKKKA